MRACLVGAVLVAFANGCADGEGPTSAILDAPAFRLGVCKESPRSLPPAIAARFGRSQYPGDFEAVFAGYARDLPGGFGGVMYDAAGPVLMLTRPEEGAAAKAALVPLLPGFPIASATVRPVRWDFAQLFEWHNYLVSRIGGTDGLVSSDKDEAANRVTFGVADEAGRARLNRRLALIDFPCDLVEVRVTGRPEWR